MTSKTLLSFWLTWYEIGIMLFGCYYCYSVVMNTMILMNLC